MKLKVPNHEGARIAILGSGPSLNEAIRNSESYDIGIAVNGAIRLAGLKFDYFQSNHAYAHSHERGWQNILAEMPEKAILMNSNSAIYWDKLFPDRDQRERLQKSQKAFLRNDSRTHILHDGAFDDEKPVNDYFTLDEVAQAPHIAYGIISTKSIKGNLLDQDELIISGASSAGAAIHMATLMGASEIVLFGVQMTNQKGGNYFISHAKAEQGRSSERQRKTLDRLFNELHERGVPISVYGDHAFESKFLRQI